MRRHQFALAASPVPSLPRRNGVAIDQLLRAFGERRPLAVMSGVGADVAGLAIDAFLERIDGDHDVIRLSKPVADPLDCMRGIVQGMGFETDGLELRDLLQVLRMFLAYQSTHRRRTILCLEEAQGASGWTLDLLADLVQREVKEHRGLFVLLSGDANLIDKLRQPSLANLAVEAGPTIHIAPFDLDETRVYINRYIEANGYGPVSQVFEFDAVTRLHDLSAGVPDTINELVVECLGGKGDTPISPDGVEEAADAISPAQTAEEPGLEIVRLPTGGHLVARFRGGEVVRRSIDAEKLLIGRRRRCDLTLADKSVSREHAMILWVEAGVRIVDLGSTNGTFVDGQLVENGVLENGAVIQLGDYEIEFVAATRG